MKIGIFDSGIGGTTIVATIKELLPNEEYFYIADSKNCPYGEKSDEELYRIVTNNVNELKAWGAKIIVIACNTATVKCIDKLRTDHPDIEFVGTEPAIKLATETNKKNILVLATPGTVASERAQELLKENQKDDQKITLLPCPGLADTIEKHFRLDKDCHPLFLQNLGSDAIYQKLCALFLGVDKNQDIVVLGCTHYSLIKSDIQTFFKNAKIIDGNSGVAHRVAAIANKLR